MATTTLVADPPEAEQPADATKEAEAETALPQAVCSPPPPSSPAPGPPKPVFPVDLLSDSVHEIAMHGHDEPPQSGVTSEDMETGALKAYPCYFTETDLVNLSVVSRSHMRDVMTWLEQVAAHKESLEPIYDDDYGGS